MTSLTFEFTHYRSPKLARMLELARLGQFSERRLTADGPALTLYTATFPIDKDSIKTVTDLAICLTAHPSAHVSANGQRINIHRVASILQCYEQSFQPSDWRAHCWQPRPARFLEDAVTRGAIIEGVDILLSCSGTTAQRTYNDGFSTLPDRDRPIWMFPCRYANCAPVATELSLRHPAGLRAQVEQALTHYECRWCPRLQSLDEWELLQWGTPP